jgi:hypothetical protein
MPDKPLPRPRQVTFSGWTIVVGSVLTILFAFQRIAELGSLEAQEAAAEFIATAPGDSLGLTVDDVQTAIRVMCLVAGGTAAATAILGWQVLQASRSARLVLSFLAPVLFVAGLTSGGLFSALVAAAVLMLWAQPARDWFHGKAPVRDAAGARAMAGGAPYPPVSERPTPPAAPTPPAGQPVGATQALPAAEQEPGSRATMTDMSQPNPYGVPPPPPPGGPVGPARRPGRVTAAVVTSITASTLTLVGLLVSLLFIGANRDDFVREVESQLAGSSAYDGISSDTVADVSLGFLVVLAVWCVLAIGLALGTLRGSSGARIALIVSASLSALVSLLGVLAIVPLALTIASIATIVLLVTGDAGAWFASRKRTG